MSEAWDTDLGRWALAWRDYRRGSTINSQPAETSLMEAPLVLDAPEESAEEAFEREIALAREVCEDQVVADAITADVTVPLPVVVAPDGQH